ncbi:MAG: YceD family protein [Candidatus Limnocylindria bacterium]
MTRPASDQPFLFNVAGLLGDDLGADRTHGIEGAQLALPDDLVLATPIEGTVRLARTNRGILADARLATSLTGECARCLRPLTTRIEIRLEEEFLPSLDLATGRSVPTDDEPEALRLTDHHEVDLEGPVRDAISLAEPIAPLDRPDCPGLCMVCGEPLDEGAHDHPDDDWDPRMEALRAFRPE